MRFSIKIVKRTAAFAVLLSAALLLGGCGLKILPWNFASKSDSQTPVADGNTYPIYYTDMEGLGLVTRNYTVSGSSFEKVAQELMQQLQNPPGQDVLSAIPDGVKLNGFIQGVDTLTVDIDAGYLSLSSNVKKVLLRAAVVRTMVNLPGVNSVSLTVDGQPMKEESGEVIPPMNEASFIDSGSEGINSYHSASLELYYPTESELGLGYEKRNVIYSSNLTMERVVVEQMIAGPRGKGLLAIAGPESAVISVRVSKGVCTVDLNARFNDMTINRQVDPEICLYAIVNSLASVCDVEKVRFRIEGESNLRFRSQVSLDQDFEPKPELVIIPGVSQKNTDEDTENSGNSGETATERDEAGKNEGSGTNSGQSGSSAEAAAGKTGAASAEAADDSGSGKSGAGNGSAASGSANDSTAAAAAAGSGSDASADADAGAGDSGSAGQGQSAAASSQITAEGSGAGEKAQAAAAASQEEGAAGTGSSADTAGNSDNAGGSGSSAAVREDFPLVGIDPALIDPDEANEEK